MRYSIQMAYLSDKMAFSSFIKTKLMPVPQVLVCQMINKVILIEPTKSKTLFSVCAE